jgi:hypothetical protein
LFKLAKQLLENQGEFLPIGTIVTPEGKVADVIADTTQEQPGARQARQDLEGVIKEWLQRECADLWEWPLTLG